MDARNLRLLLHRPRPPLGNPTQRLGLGFGLSREGFAEGELPTSPSWSAFPSPSSKRGLNTALMWFPQAVLCWEMPVTLCPVRAWEGQRSLRHCPIRSAPPSFAEGRVGEVWRGRGPRHPKDGSRVPALAACQAPPTQPPLYCGADFQEALYFCQRGFNWPQSTEANLDQVQGRPTPTPPRRPFLFFIYS